MKSMKMLQFGKQKIQVKRVEGHVFLSHEHEQMFSRSLRRQCRRRLPGNRSFLLHHVGVIEQSFSFLVEALFSFQTVCAQQAAAADSTMYHAGSCTVMLRMR
ncbi:hypothetical protein H0G86_005529 [Trichoderma simmonsii]|uniref:Uncharacterized protein n=1 Tax=Trichoderma simmonsii TaxID=1491479 RepID=A0A8G0LET2_9HYPO|nr:hypothetical protein H0G86_005529 [Trichoderma simmonsii]